MYEVVERLTLMRASIRILMHHESPDVGPYKHVPFQAWHRVPDALKELGRNHVLKCNA